MSGKDKLIERFCTLPKDFTFDEVLRLMRGFGFELSNKGATSGSRVAFRHSMFGQPYIMHKSHPSGVIKPGALKALYTFLITTGFIRK